MTDTLNQDAFADAFRELFCEMLRSARGADRVAEITRAVINLVRAYIGIVDEKNRVLYSDVRVAVDAIRLEYNLGADYIDQTLDQVIEAGLLAYAECLSMSGPAETRRRSSRRALVDHIGFFEAARRSRRTVTL